MRTAAPASELSVHPSIGDKRALAVISPANWNRMLEIEDLLRRVLPGVELVAPPSLEAMEEVIRGSRGVAELIIAMGGDGTLHRVLQWIDLDTQILGLLPGGTGNDLARSLGYPEDLRGRVAHLQNLAPQTIDMGLLHGAAPEPIRYHTCAGTGLDAATLAMRNSNEILRRNYKLAFGCALFRLRSMQTELHVDGRSLEGEYLWILAMNNRDIGRGTRIAPDAKLDDGLLDLILVEKLGALELIRLMPRAERGEHIHHRAVDYMQAAGISCRFAVPVERVAVDGELYRCSTNELRFSLQPRALTILR